MPFWPLSPEPCSSGSPFELESGLSFWPDPSLSGSDFSELSLESAAFFSSGLPWGPLSAESLVLLLVDSGFEPFLEVFSAACLSDLLLGFSDFSLPGSGRPPLDSGGFFSASGSGFSSRLVSEEDSLVEVVVSVPVRVVWEPVRPDGEPG